MDMTWLEPVRAVNLNAVALKLKDRLAQPCILFYSYEKIFNTRRFTSFCELLELDMILDSVTGVAARHDRHSASSSGIYTNYGLTVIRQYYAAPGCLKVTWCEPLAHSHTCFGSLRTTISASPLLSSFKLGSPMPSDQTLSKGYLASNPSRRALEAPVTRKEQTATCATAFICCK